MSATPGRLPHQAALLDATNVSQANVNAAYMAPRTGAYVNSSATLPAQHAGANVVHPLIYPHGASFGPQVGSTGLTSVGHPNIAPLSAVSIFYPLQAQWTVSVARAISRPPVSQSYADVQCVQSTSCVPLTIVFPDGVLRLYTTATPSGGYICLSDVQDAAQRVLYQPASTGVDPAAYNMRVQAAASAPPLNIDCLPLIGPNYAVLLLKMKVFARADGALIIMLFWG